MESDESNIQIKSFLSTQHLLTDVSGNIRKLSEWKPPSIYRDLSGVVFQAITFRRIQKIQDSYSATGANYYIIGIVLRHHLDASMRLLEESYYRAFCFEWSYDKKKDVTHPLHMLLLYSIIVVSEKKLRLRISYTLIVLEFPCFPSKSVLALSKM